MASRGWRTKCSVVLFGLVALFGQLGWIPLDEHQLQLVKELLGGASIWFLRDAVGRT